MGSHRGLNFTIFSRAWSIVYRIANFSVIYCQIRIVLMDPCLFFSRVPVYGMDVSHRKEWVHMHFVMARSTPKKGPLRTYGLIDVSIRGRDAFSHVLSTLLRLSQWPGYSDAIYFGQIG